MNGQESAAPLRLGTRRSALAMAQSGMVAREVIRVTGRPVELVEITTYGDTSREALAQIGGTGVFVSALRDALLAGEIDLAVHSLKDLPTAAPEGLILAAVPEREDSRDALVARDGLTLEELVEKSRAEGTAGHTARIGTGSPRRMAQLNAWAAERGAALETVAIRGNVDTRIGYVAKGELDAVVLATAGLNRLGRSTEITEHLDTELMLPAPGQGALAIECVSPELAAGLSALDHAPTRAAVTAERALLAALEAGCSAPVAALAAWDGTELRLEGVVGTVDGATLLKMTATGPLLLDETAERQATALGHALAARLLDAGAATLMGERAR
ncbi:hydroxymethylbilane synthase [Kitasatospora sp. NPDC002227]|uniref:hydroxymethylbilane synthase n=1 Tax=Kitasatospora sp. NPDC002227 TaxID=3154773 RepID=UPI00332961BD